MYPIVLHALLWDKGIKSIVAVVSSIQKSAKLQLFWLIKTEAVGIKHVGFMWRNKKCQK
jgi:hypothetical protein